MAWRDLFRRRVTTTDLFNVGTVRPPAPDTSGREHGVSGTDNYGGIIRNEDFNPEFDDFRRAVKIYDKMRTDAQIRAMLQVMKLPLRGATWTAIPPENGDPVDRQIADAVNNALFDDDAMEQSWDFVLRHVLGQLEYGFSVLEIVWTVDDKGMYRFRRLAPRLPKTIYEWHVDRNGKLLAVTQYAPVVGTSPDQHLRPQPGAATRPPLYRAPASYQYITIPADRLAVFSFDREGDNYEGRSLLRSVYKNWFYKDQIYHLEGVRLDRWGVGIPIAKLEPGNTVNSAAELEKLVKVLKGIRSNEKAYLVEPVGVSFRIVPEGSSSGSGSSGAVQLIDHHDSQIARNVLAGFLTMGRDPRGTLGFGSRLTDMFISSLNGIAKGIAGDLKHQIVMPFCDLNFDMTRRQYPTIICRDLETTDLDNLIEALTGMEDSFITVQDDDERMLRKILQLSPLRHENSRQAKSEAEKVKAATAPPPTDPAADQANDADAPDGKKVGEAINALKTEVQKLTDSAARASQPIHVEVHPSPAPAVHVAPVTHLHVPGPGKTKTTMHHDLDPKSPTYGQMIGKTDEPVDDDDEGTA